MAEFNVETQKMIQESPYQAELKQILVKVEGLLNDHDLKPTDTQWLIMVNHINEMIKRKHTKTSLEGIDVSLFQEISDTALNISQTIVKEIGDLPIEESYLLSIHFETIKQNH